MDRNISRYKAQRLVRKELKIELRQGTPMITSARELYLIGKGLIEIEREDYYDPRRGCQWSPRTLLGELAVQAYERGYPREKLP